MSKIGTRISVIGVGSMGGAVAARLIETGHEVTVWNRTASKAEALRERGAVVAEDLAAAIDASELIVILLLNYDIAEQNLWPLAAHLRGKTVVNLTTGTDVQANAWAEWAESHDIAYVDGAIMATPDLIGHDEALLLYSGLASAYDRHLSILEQLGTSQYFGPKPGTASLYDTAMLTGMYTMFTGFLHGAAVVAKDGLTAVDLAAGMSQFLGAMAHALPHVAQVVDSGNFETGTEQTLDFTANALDIIAANASSQDIDTSLLDLLRGMVERQREAGFGQHDFARLALSFTKE
ncbi:NAD(P)-dependent oxidoreductase [Natronoglycomyces albus]|uniref:NAD(P)-dependent oxidoreductase n=1 Tax=Natronoglycomyces albus TaxID=2811108 RepID=A0A895XL52_9ACTN|nr:NAD(P)-binding domain-containing protein [Natronoglycomyces albus]QSB06441.1 NAD(P)-dependent oxidoreductase [Natronoglycomyces albus]